MKKVANDCAVWLGGFKKQFGSGWEWLDGRKWEFQNWDSYSVTNCWACDCVSNLYGRWSDNECNERHPFVCSTTPLAMLNNHTMMLDRASLLSPTLHFWWNHNVGEKYEHPLGIEISWWIKNGIMPRILWALAWGLATSIFSMLTGLAIVGLIPRAISLSEAVSWCQAEIVC